MKLELRVAIDGVPKRLTVDTADIVTAVKEQMKNVGDNVYYDFANNKVYNHTYVKETDAMGKVVNITYKKVECTKISDDEKQLIKILDEAEDLLSCIPQK